MSDMGKNRVHLAVPKEAALRETILSKVKERQGKSTNLIADEIMQAVKAYADERVVEELKTIEQEFGGPLTHMGGQVSSYMMRRELTKTEDKK